MTSNVEPASRRWQPILSLVGQLSKDTLTASINDSTVSDRLKLTRKVFFCGVLHGLRAEMLQPQAALFLAGELQLVGAFMEGESAGLAICDRLMPWRANIWCKLRDASCNKHPYEIHAGLGMGLGILGGNAERLFIQMQLGALWQWFAVDGLGFQQALCDPRKYVVGRAKPRFRLLPDYACRVFDQGLGRSLWFIFAGDIDKITEAINKFAPDRRPDLWLGMGVAAAHTGGASAENLSKLRAIAGEHKKHLAAGAIVAAHIRSLAGTKAQITDHVCYILAGMSAEQGAAIVETAHKQVGNRREIAHEAWQAYILNRISRR